MYLPNVAAFGFYLTLRPNGLVLHMRANGDHMRQMRAYVFAAVISAGEGERMADAARLVANELVTHVVSLGGPWTPVVVEIASGPDRIEVRVHHPEPSTDRLERTSVDDVDAMRRVSILDALAPGRIEEATSAGKVVTARLRCPASTGD